MRKERKILRFVPQKLRNSFANGNPKQEAPLIIAILKCEVKNENIFINIYMYI